VTGFLGPNGTVRVNGKHYPESAAPMSELGILLDARSVHPGLSARNNLLALARTAGIGRRRVEEVIELAGLSQVAGARAGGFSLAMGQRLGVAAALLVVLGRGRLITEASVEDFTDHAAAGVLVRTPETARLGQVLAAHGVTVIDDGTDLLRVSGTTAEQIGAAAWRAHLSVYESPRAASSTTPERRDERRHPDQARACPDTVAGPVTQVRVVRAEWTKLRGLRSTWWCVLIAVVLIVGLGAAIAGSGAPYKISAGNSAVGGVTLSLVGILFAQLVLGVLAFSGKYATGMIRATLAEFFVATTLESSRGATASKPSCSPTNPG
jgi:ABC-2 type transport system ATP-binding protein